jgi:hypothetical protein
MIRHVPFINRKSPNRSRRIALLGSRSFKKISELHSIAGPKKYPINTLPLRGVRATTPERACHF